uniref:Hyaluronan/mRNA-binding protein domain-containing protein n=1 Tax=Xiphophorus couchianus TaxID=32473 RepID=A0A3B5LR55_9TELE
MPGHLQEGFGCVVTNRFDQLLDDESDPFEVLKAAENKKKEGAAAGSTKTAAQAAKQPKKESQKDRKNPLLDKKEESQAPVPLKKEGKRWLQWLQQNKNRNCIVFFVFCDCPIRPSGDRPPRGRGGGRGGRGGRGRGMGRGEGFDSLKRCTKRGGSGSHNWGTVKDEVSEAEQTAAPEPTPEGEENAPAGSENKENEVEEVKQEGPKEMTLDEWKAMQDKERTKVEFNIRKPNEGADSQWKKGYVLHKSKSEDQGAADESSDHHFRKPANDITSQLEINFGDLGRPGRGRGGARGGRGGRGGGGSRTASGVSVPNVDDPEAFPALA